MRLVNVALVACVSASITSPAMACTPATPAPGRAAITEALEYADIDGAVRVAEETAAGLQCATSILDRTDLADFYRWGAAALVRAGQRNNAERWLATSLALDPAIVVAEHHAPGLPALAVEIRTRRLGEAMAVVTAHEPVWLDGRPVEPGGRVEVSAGPHYLQRVGGPIVSTQYIEIEPGQQFVIGTAPAPVTTKVNEEVRQSTLHFVTTARVATGFGLVAPSFSNEFGQASFALGAGIAPFGSIALGANVGFVDLQAAGGLRGGTLRRCDGSQEWLTSPTLGGRLALRPGRGAWHPLIGVEGAVWVLGRPEVACGAGQELTGTMSLGAARASAGVDLDLTDALGVGVAVGGELLVGGETESRSTGIGTSATLEVAVRVMP